MSHPSYPVDWVTTSPTDKHATYNASAKGKARRTRYRHDNSMHQTNATYLSREFVMWDGEGITLDDGSHIYVMFGHSKGGYIADESGLSSATILDYVLSEYRKYPDTIHCIYGGSYDFNMWMSAASYDTLNGVYTRDFSRFGPYLIQWRRGKSFFVKVPEMDTKTKGVTMFDVISFFQCSFVKACDSYLGDQFTDRELIVTNKALRAGFTHNDIPTMHRYMMAELDNGVRLMTELRERLNAVNLRPKRWDGPGAIAASLLTREKVKDSLTKCPDPVAEAGRYAYFGGRFEVVQYGAVHDAPAYEYDVNSAYPYALQFVPNLRRGEWIRTENPEPPTNAQGFALWHVTFKGADYRLPMPLPWRSFKGNVVYPGDGSFSGWYWTPDVMSAVEYTRRYGGTLTLNSTWHFREDNALDRPFWFIAELYKQRQALKAAEDGAHVGIKLALNSLYGKLAQQVGAREYEDGWRTPPFHQLEYAGYTTATCRSMVYRAAINDLSKVIAYETDALFTTQPLDIAEGTDLGSWEYTKFDDLTYVQSGVYFGSVDGKPFSKTRGVNLGTLTRENVEAAMQRDDAPGRRATAELTQFITAGLALRGRWRDWCRWITTTKHIEVEPQGKRVPLPGRFGQWNRTFAARVTEGSHSSPFPVLWINPNEGMDELEELRDMGSSEFHDLLEGYSE